ncbi:hypothetical protein [Pedobacter sp.]|jgi:hypothetical protein|uniref:hypothetical protein n=1 Tax=Pedobacter sp. TaxID=1411316 RepID=UPI002CAA088D|nr:hypothetical protein [Pedobacter sp.]HWW41719.1 hypothetical protein [Pedobacter sp.]
MSEPDQNEPSGLRILIKSSDAKAIQTLQDLQTEELYNTHTNELKEMLDMCYKFSDNYLAILEKYVLSCTKISQKELYRIAFSAEMEQAHFGQRPFSKFKNDILKELEIIK